MSFESEFELVPLGQVASFINGDRSTNYPKGEDYVDNGIPFISAADLSDGCVQQSGVKRISTAAYERLRNGKIQDRDVLFCLRGSIGKLAYVHPNEAGAIASSLVIVRANSKIDSRYLYFILRSQAGQQAAASLNNGSAQPNLSVSELQKVAVPLPPMPIQRQIAATLDSFDDRITLLRETNATLEAIAQALFKSWFVDFDPVRAKMAGRTPEGMDEATAALFPDGFETSELGEVPKGWQIGSLSGIALLNEKAWTARNAPDQILYIDLAGVKSNAFEVPQTYTFSDAPSRARRVLRSGDCIVGTVRPGNRSFGFIVESHQSLTGSTGFAVLSPRRQELAAFAYLGATRKENIDRLASLADGGAYPAVKPELVAATTCVLPSDEVMKTFDEVARPLLDAIGANSVRAQTLSILRDTLLPRLISGQLRLPEAQSTVEEALA